MEGGCLIKGQAYFVSIAIGQKFKEQVTLQVHGDRNNCIGKELIILFWFHCSCCVKRYKYNLAIETGFPFISTIYRSEGTDGWGIAEGHLFDIMANGVGTYWVGCLLESECLFKE